MISVNGKDVKVEVNGEELKDVTSVTLPKWMTGPEKVDQEYIDYCKPLRPGVILIDDPIQCIHCSSQREYIRRLERENKTLHKKIRKLKGGKRR